MIRKYIKPTVIIFVLCILVSIFMGEHATAITQNPLPKSIINNFGKDPRISRNFTWYTDTSIKKSILEYSVKDKFYGFDKTNIVRVTAQSHEVKTNSDKREIHKVELINLIPGTEYIYRVRNDKGGFSSQGVFKTAEQNLQKFTFVNITDTQGTTSKDYTLWKNTLDKALGKFPDARFLLHTGDMEDSGQNIYQWDLFANAVKDELMNIPIAPVVGNHETINNNKTNPNAKNFTDRFDIYKEQNTGAPAGTVYSFDYGNAHIAVMNTQSGSTNLKKQADWLLSDMSKTHKLWKIVALHRGPYGATYDTTDIRKAWVSVFDQLGIDLVLQGHDHNYVRSYPMKNNVKVKAGEGTVYVGGNTGGVKFYPRKLRPWQALDLQPYTQMYVAVTVDNHKMTIGAYDVKNKLQDSFSLEK
ncbi:MAG TPA: metallophosphoesterase family protein [Ruminiclostridium sp.]